MISERDVAAAIGSHAYGSDGSSVGTVDGYFQSLLYKPLDRYSYTEPTAGFNQRFTEGRAIFSWRRSTVTA